jgi:hypothetical protein
VRSVVAFVWKRLWSGFDRAMILLIALAVLAVTKAIAGKCGVPVP